MRHFGFAALLTALACAAHALELEESRHYPAEGARTELRILSTADVDVFEPIILAFQSETPGVAIQYDVASSAQVMQGLYEEGAQYDLALSSAMDLQIKLANDGFAQTTQDSRNSENFWQLTEVMGRLNARLYCCSGQMIRDVSNGTLAVAYNVLGSYAQSQLADNPGIEIIEMDDYVSVMLRSAIIPVSAHSVEDSGAMIDFLASLSTRPDLAAQTGLPPVEKLRPDEAPERRPIRLGPGLLVFLDKMRRETFLRSWVSSMEQR